MRCAAETASPDGPAIFCRNEAGSEWTAACFALVGGDIQHQAVGGSSMQCSVAPSPVVQAAQASGSSLEAAQNLSVWCTLAAVLQAAMAYAV